MSKESMYYLQVEINDLSKPDYELALSHGSSTFGLFHLLSIISIGCEDYIIPHKIMNLQMRKIGASEQHKQNLIDDGILIEIPEGFYLPFTVDKLNGAFSKSFVGFFNSIKKAFTNKKQLTAWNNVMNSPSGKSINQMLESPIFLSLDTPLTRGLKSTLPTNIIEENRSITEPNKKGSVNTSYKNKTSSSSDDPLEGVTESKPIRKEKAIAWAKENYDWWSDKYTNLIMHDKFDNHMLDPLAQSDKYDIKEWLDKEIKKIKS